MIYGFKSSRSPPYSRISDSFANRCIFSFILPVIGVVGEVVKFVGVIRGLEEDPSPAILFCLSASLSFV